jgi:hypothetical protein
VRQAGPPDASPVELAETHFRLAQVSEHPHCALDVHVEPTARQAVVAKPHASEPSAPNVPQEASSQHPASAVHGELTAMHEASAPPSLAHAEPDEKNSRPAPMMLVA